MMGAMGGDTSAEAMAGAKRFGQAVRGLAAPTLTEFVLARIAEREAWAQAELDLASMYDPAEYVLEYRWARLMRRRSTRTEVGSSFAPGAPSPSEVLADCEAKRRMIRRAMAAEEALGDDIDDQTYFIRMACRDTWQLALKDVALPYADHPDYRDEWRP